MNLKLNLKSKPQLIAVIGVPVLLISIIIEDNINKVSISPELPGVEVLLYAVMGLSAVAFLVLRQRK